jgi:soluble lytic murein transglycosylase-like protein
MKNRIVRKVSALAAALMAGSLFMAPPAQAAGFTDTAGSGFRGEIHWMYQTGLSNGWGDGTYRPLESISREAMAAFMYRVAGSPQFVPPSVSPFTDVPVSHPFYREIAWLKHAGLTTGWGDGSFHPSEPISREAMAAFLYRYSGQYCRSAAAAGYAAPAASPFRDVPADSGFYKEVSWAKHSGISSGWSDGTYHPDEAISREAMAAFIKRTYEYLGVRGGCLSANNLSQAEIKAIIVETAQKMGVDPSLALAFGEQESGFRQHVRSGAGAIGTMQIMPITGQWTSELVGRQLNVHDARDNITAGVALIRQLIRTSPDLETAIASYYQGQYSVMTQGMFQETKRYVASVLARQATFR